MKQCIFNKKILSIPFIRTTILFIIVPIILSSCGGGGDSETAITSTVYEPPALPQHTVVVSKGPVSNARCELFDSSGKRLNTDATTLVGVGHFSGLELSVGDYYVECQGGDYIDEATKKVVSMPSDTKLRGMVHVADPSDEAKIIVTPISELAFRAAEEKEDLTTYSTELKKVTKKLGLNPEKDFSNIAPTLDLNKVDDSDSGQYAMLLAAISQLQKNNDQALPKVLDDLKDKLSNQPEEQVQDVIKRSLKDYANEQDFSSSTEVDQSLSASSVLKRLGETTYSVSGAVIDLIGSVTLQLNGKNDLVVDSSSTTFQFPKMIVEGLKYAVTVKTHPTNTICEVSNGSGIVNNNINNIEVRCFDSHHSIGGTIRGLINNLTLKITMHMIS